MANEAKSVAKRERERERERTLHLDIQWMHRISILSIRKIVTPNPTVAPSPVWDIPLDILKLLLELCLHKMIGMYTMTHRKLILTAH